ncbi:MAG: excinuclease ABC subunit UvrC [SAR324 cluster bacterium]|nr:excinuclease ABC subunit UvrC [SAR324 cluster bacterium]
MSETPLPLDEKLALLPEAPGIYMYKNQSGDILYIGKAKSLKKRVRSYFYPSAKHTLRIQVMIRLAYDMSIIVTDTEAEALILEEQLIKTHQPRYNILLKDDKSYPYCKLTVNEMYPRLFLVREKRDKNAEYYGPYTSVRDTRHIVEVIQRYFPLRTSKMELDGTKTYRPCLNFQMKRCLAPCTGQVKVEDYQEAVNQVRLFFKGKDQELAQSLETKMQEAAAELKFEKAAQIRDQLRAIQRIWERQKIISQDKHDQDVFNFYRESDTAGVQVMFVRNGRLIGTDFFFMEHTESVSDDNLLGQALNRIYTGDAPVIPHEVFLPFHYSDQEVLEQTLSDVSGRKISILVPQKGQKKELVSMAYNNAKINLQEKRQRIYDQSKILEQVKYALHLRKEPQMVEAFDISHLGGNHTVASLVCWKDNKPFKEQYRKYKIQSVQGPDDFASMKEVLSRRYQRAVSGEMPLPDMIMIDGGRGQLNIAVEVLKELGISLDQVDLIGLAKGRSDRRKKVQRPNQEDFEYVIKPNQKNEIRLHRHSAVLFFLQNIRDESHRFAITFQRELKRKQNLHSLLDEIPGIGPHRKKSLLKHFGSLKRVRDASVEDLQQVRGVSAELAQCIRDFLSQAPEESG